MSYGRLCNGIKLPRCGTAANDSNAYRKAGAYAHAHPAVSKSMHGCWHRNCYGPLHGTDSSFRFLTKIKCVGILLPIATRHESTSMSGKVASTSGATDDATSCSDSCTVILLTVAPLPSANDASYYVA